MSSNGFIDLDSTYRNRQIWPKPGQFEVNIAQSGTRQKGNALDPVSLAEPLVVWSCNALTTSQSTTFQLYGEISPPNFYGNVGYNQNSSNLTIVFTDQYNNSIQQEDNYYVGLIFWNINQSTFSRITSFKYIGNSQTTPPTYSLALISINDQISFEFGDNFLITDDSDLSRSDYPLLFIPNGKSQDNAYLNYILYCENNNDYRNINYYDGLYKYVISDEWTGISNYQEYGNFCIRKIPPTFPLQLEASRFVKPNSTSSVINVDVATLPLASLKIFDIPNSTAILERIEIPYKYDFLRLRPYRTTDVNPNIVAAHDIYLPPESRPTIMVYSNNGINWLNSPSPSVSNLVTNIANNGPNATSLRYVAVTYENMRYSNDGITWVDCTDQPLISVSSVVYQNTDNRWYVSDVTGLVISGIDGDTWPVSDYPWIPSGLTWCMCNKPNSSRIFIGGRNDITTSAIMYGRYDGSGWVWITAVTQIETCRGIATDGTITVAVGISPIGKTIGYSLNAYDFIPSDDNPFGVDGEGRCVATNGDYWLVGGITPLGVPIIAKSTNGGVSWIVSPKPPIGNNISTIIWYNTYWIVTGDFISGDTYSWAATSLDGLTWTTEKTNYNNYVGGSGISVYNENQNYDSYTGIYNMNNKSQSRQIISYYNDGNTATFEVYPPFDIDSYADGQYTIEVEPYSYDNTVPFSYNGTLVQQNICYEFELIQLILPNFTLSTGFGSKIAFYPYIYVELSNVSSSGARLVNMMHSNNPNAVKMLFKVPIYDVQDPESTPFVRLVAIGMIHIMKFKPDDNLYFTVLLPNGDVFDTILPEYFSPSVPNFEAQVSALFRYKAVI